MALEELDYDHTLHEREFAGDEKLHVRIFMDVLPDVEASEKTGMRKFRDAEMIQIIVPGDKRNIVTREILDKDKIRFSKHYDRFKAGQTEQTVGFPLAQWPQMTRSMAEELKYLGFHTVEQIAKAGDNILSRYPGLREIQTRAKLFLEAQESAAPIERLQNELKSRDDQIAALQKQMAEVLAMQKKAA